MLTFDQLQDILIKKLTVEPPGDTVFMNSAVFLDLRSSEFATSPLERNISVNIPKVAVKGSERIFIATAPGKIAGASGAL